MIKNIFVEIEYDGTGFFGSQVQNRGRKYQRRAYEPTIQSEMETALRRLFKKKVTAVFSGRTDRGVHARAQAVSFAVDTNIPLSNIRTALNTFLAPAVRITRIKKVPLSFHARFSARAKTYYYVILNSRQPSVFERDRCWWIGEKLDTERMRKCARLFEGKKDFSRFALKASAYQDCVRTIYAVTVKRRGTKVIISVSGDGFLRGMVRNIVSFMVRTAKKEFTLRQAGEIVRGEGRYDNRPAPPQGLYLEKVFYAPRPE